MKKQKQRQEDHKSPNLSARLIPCVDGVYGVKALTYEYPGTEIGVYRSTLREAECWIQNAALAGRYDVFMMWGDGFWRIYDGSGSQYAKLSKLRGRPREEHRKPIEVDRAELEKDAAKSAGRDDLSCLAVFEDHVGANCADQTNFAALTSWLVDVAAEEDLNHIYIIESQRWPCRVAGLFAGLQKLGDAPRDLFLDYYPYLATSHPLDFENHRARLSRRLALHESKEIGEQVRQSLEIHKFEDDYGNVMIEGDEIVDQFLSAPLRTRQRFVRLLLELEGYESEPGRPEKLSRRIMVYPSRLPISATLDILGLLYKG